MRFEDTDELKEAEFVNVDLARARFRNVDLTGARVTEARLVNARLSGLIEGLMVNDVEVEPLIAAELVRRYPERANLQPDDADGARVAWRVIEDLWTASKQRASALPEPILHARVDGEWSFLETLRHLIFVTDSWISAAVLGRTDHHHAYGMPPSFITDQDAFGIDRTIDPSLAEVVPVREERMAVVRALLGELDDDGLRGQRGDHTVRECLWILFDEEWHHNWFANRDLDVLVRDRSSREAT